jgi:hypothetical protein
VPWTEKEIYKYHNYFICSKLRNIKKILLGEMVAVDSLKNVINNYKTLKCKKY